MVEGSGIKEVVLGTGPVPATVALTTPPEAEQEARVEFVVCAWVLDDDGMGCAVLLMPSGKCGRLDKLVDLGWRDPELRFIRPQAGPALVVPS